MEQVSNPNRILIPYLILNEGRLELKEHELKENYLRHARYLREIQHKYGLSVGQVFSYVNSEPLIRNIWDKYRSYCVDIYGAYQSIEQRYFYEDWLGYIERKNDKYVLDELEHRCLAEDLELAYVELVIRPNCVAYAHKRIGWKNFNTKIGDDFNYDITTNFGYGRVSYFVLSVTFKGVQICPFSLWVGYRSYPIIDILSYTRTYDVKLSSWKKLFTYVKESYNLAAESIDKFIQKYIIEEIKTVIDYLIDVIDNRNYEKPYWDADPESKTIYETLLSKFYDFSIVAEKVAGSSKFIIKLLELNEVVKVKEYLVLIDSFIDKFYPILRTEYQFCTSQKSYYKDEIGYYRPIVGCLRRQLKKRKISEGPIFILHRIYSEFLNTYIGLSKVFDVIFLRVENALMEVKSYLDDRTKILASS
jgi:hypothetical protein